MDDKAQIELIGTTERLRREMKKMKTTEEALRELLGDEAFQPVEIPAIPVEDLLIEYQRIFLYKIFLAFGIPADEEKGVSR